MFLDEQEARGKWCPLARVRDVTDASDVEDATDRSWAVTSINREATGLIRGLCVASACMAWRGTSSPEGKSFGYCGAFGRPA